MRDIAERRLLEQEVIHLERMRVSGELAAGVSHNLNEPEARGISVEVVTELGETPDIRGNPAELGDAILNLVLNAVQAMPEGGAITITTQSVEAGVQLTVSDTGMGMDDETRQRVFEPFFTTKADVGSGLGLSTVNGMVTRRGGTIAVDSTPGQGTTFTLCFPA